MFINDHTQLFMFVALLLLVFMSNLLYTMLFIRMFTYVQCTLTTSHFQEIQHPHLYAHTLTHTYNFLHAFQRRAFAQITMQNFRPKTIAHL